MSLWLIKNHDIKYWGCEGTVTYSWLWNETDVTGQPHTLAISLQWAIGYLGSEAHLDYSEEKSYVTAKSPILVTRPAAVTIPTDLTWLLVLSSYLIPPPKSNMGIISTANHAPYFGMWCHVLRWIPVLWRDLPPPMFTLTLSLRQADTRAHTHTHTHPILYYC